MKIIDTIFASLIFLSCVVLTLYYLFYNPFGFNYEFNDYGQYFAVFLILCCWLVFLVMSRLLNKKPAFGQGLVLFIAVISILYLLFSRYYSFANEYFTNITVAILLCTMLLSAGIGVVHSLLIFLVLTFLWQLYIAFRQMHGFAFNIQRLNIRGTMYNSSIFSCYLVSQLPFFYYLFFCIPALLTRGKQPVIPKQVMLFLKIVCITVFAMVVALVVLIIWRSQSRTAMLALGALLFSIFIFFYGKAAKAYIYKLPKLLSLSIACAFIAGLSYAAWYLINLKKLSAITRVMTLDISKDHLTDHFWLGTGIGRFTWYYPQWQAQYFATHPAPPKDYFLSAGETYYLFNEYVQLFQTIGLPGFIVFILILIWFFTARSFSHSTLLNAARLTVITVLACGFSTYPFHINMLLLLLAFCFAIAAIVNDHTWSLFSAPRIPHQFHNTVARLLPVVLIIIAGFATYTAFGQWQAMQNWTKLRNRLDGTRAEIKGEYSRLYKLLQYDGKFLTDYGMTLLDDSSDCNRAVVILEEAKQYFISKVTIESLAQAYKKTGDYKKAIENYEWLCHYLPNKFGTRLELLKLYDVRGDRANARKTANLILTMPVKIRSRELDRIKIETQNILNRLQ
jgi:hypothetical protein